ncbi:hypothetical protein F2Q69_00015119 [Brassica cretica]|uniref:Uncharacterized protein n=1 Tax=Brassica cretica TaxID=69181 RepID=A0A8S9R1N0_BRACR|nr:hypothetical protein F2Q69_00015119 [Brassica cretica]
MIQLFISSFFNISEDARALYPSSMDGDSYGASQRRFLTVMSQIEPILRQRSLTHHCISPLKDSGSSPPYLSLMNPPPRFLRRRLSLRSSPNMKEDHDFFFLLSHRR